MDQCGDAKWTVGVSAILYCVRDDLTFLLFCRGKLHVLTSLECVGDGNEINCGTVAAYRIGVFAIGGLHNL